MNVSLNSTHVSFVLFNKRPYSVISFDKVFYQSNEAVSAVLEFLPPLLQPGKRLDLALRYLNSTVFTEASGDRPGNKDVAVIITDGFVNKGGEKDVSDAISALKSNNVKLLTISTDRVNIREEVLYEIAGINVLLCSSLEELTASVEKIASIACDG
ncbi:uncharacterized protein [Montipora foliosa]|uniref:uncharacterized protein n=1 Tax=Montipora foliosa TaxID=591990 RepID=UPI0035F10EFC